MVGKLVGCIVAFFTLVSCGAEGAEHKFMPENDLWLEDCISCESFSLAPVTQDMFNKIIAAGRKAYAANAKANKETLVINAKWTSTTVNADCSRYNGIVTVNMYGALARRQEITPEGFTLVLAHELNHAYGGMPYYANSDRMSGEGQADYMSTKDGYAKIAALVPELRASIDADTFVKNTCNKAYGRFADARFNNCLHALEGGKSLANLLAVLSDDPVANYETPDPLVVKKTVTTYPATTQCRMDSYLAGELLSSRPKCWFYK
jgi:hypothetical protein